MKIFSKLSAKVKERNAFLDALDVQLFCQKQDQADAIAALTADMATIKKMLEVLVPQ